MARTRRTGAHHWGVVCVWYASHDYWGSTSLLCVVPCYSYGVEHVLKLPIDADINDSAETGVPIVLSDEAHPIAQHYLGLADTLIQEVRCPYHSSPTCN